jgi:hypothetical protein
MSSPGTPVEGIAVIPDGGIVEVFVVDPGFEDFDCILVPFNIADDSISFELAGKQSATPPGI